MGVPYADMFGSCGYFRETRGSSGGETDNGDAGDRFRGMAISPSKVLKIMMTTMRK